MHVRISWMVGLVCAAAIAPAQSWMSSYDTGLASAKKGDWASARTAFKQAIAYRTEDFSKATILPGPATERRVWRNGVPYSPNFLAAYSAFKLGSAEKDATARNKAFAEAATELEALLAKQQNSYETFFVLNAIYAQGDNNAKRIQLEEKLTQVSGQLTWKVDVEPMSPEEISLVAQMTGRDINQPGIPTVDPNAGGTPSSTGNAPMLSNSGIRVPINSNKYALIIGNSESKLESLKIASGADDAQHVRESLMANAGYGEQNIDLVINATAQQIRASVKAMADRVSEDATVFIFFSGVGANLDGKDFIAGVDTESATDSSSMVAKKEIYAMFSAKGARIFAFFQANRPVVNGRYFGAEVPMNGNIAQMQSTIPGATVQSYTRNGKERGVFADSLAATLGDFRSNRIPIQEFGWQVFYRIRRGGTGSIGGGSQQTPTLPVLIGLAFDARF